MAEKTIPLIVILGPTGIGKTALGIKLALHFNGEIISADSRQFYRGMDIGTAKPDAVELQQVKHHLIDIADPDETVGLAQFLNLAKAAITNIAAEGKVPFIVGGTGQYIKALLEGWQVPEIPPDPALRAELEKRAQTDPDGLWMQLMSLDPQAQSFIDPRNIRRVIRALEVCIISQQPFSELRKRIKPPYRALLIGLTTDREALYNRVDERVDKMMGSGLLSEVQNLVRQGYGWALPAMSGLGYSQFQPYFRQQATLLDVSERIKLDTHAFIRRQYTWYRASDPDIQWFDIQDPSYSEQTMALVADFLT